uniref:Uncharacterized protein n=1 Tax=Cacopsylla melanoneura TaxID=428564 RepID=A0A8D8UEF5_9HEMI
MLRSFVNQRQTNWDSYLSEFAFAINTSKQCSTGFSPTFLMYGRDAEPVRCTRRELELSNPQPSTSSDPVPYPEYVHKRQVLKEIYELVNISQAKASAKQAQYYNKAHNTQVSYSTGDLVLRRNYRLSSAPDHYNRKLDVLWLGPCRVVARVNHVIYTVRDVDGTWESNYHVKDLRPYVQSVH